MANLAAILGGASFGHGEIPFREPTNKSMNSHARGVLSRSKRLAQKALVLAHGLMLMANVTQHAPL